MKMCIHTVIFTLMSFSFNYNYSGKKVFLSGSIFKRFGCVQQPRQLSCEVFMEHLFIGLIVQTQIAAYYEENKKVMSMLMQPMGVSALLSGGAQA